MMRRREESRSRGRKGQADPPVKHLFAIAWLAAALATPAVASAGDQAYISWTVGDQKGRPTVTWEISGATKWYVGVIQIARSKRVNSKGDFLPESLVAYEVLSPERPPGFWVGPRRLGPGTYYGRLKLRYDGPCSRNCQFATSVRSFSIAPPPLRALRWRAAAGIGRVTVRWTRPRNGWYVSSVLVDDNRNFSSPADGVAWPAATRRTRWTSILLARDRYYVRLRVKQARCASCVWTAPAKTVDVKQTNSAPRLRPARFEVTHRDPRTRKHTWRVTFTACDRTKGPLDLEIREQMGRIEGRVAFTKTTVRTLAQPDGCRTYTVSKRSFFAFRPGRFVRVTIRVRDSLGTWSFMARKVTWDTTA
jgi:hypothetical protein